MRGGPSVLSRPSLRGTHWDLPSHHYCGFGQWCSIRAALAIILWGSSKDMRPDMRNGLAWPRGQLKCS